MNCYDCKKILSLGEKAWKHDTTQAINYYCDPCKKATIFFGIMPIPGYIDFDAAGNSVWVDPTVPAAAAVSTPASPSMQDCYGCAGSFVNGDTAWRHIYNGLTYYYCHYCKTNRFFMGSPPEEGVITIDPARNFISWSSATKGAGVVTTVTAAAIVSKCQHKNFDERSLSCPDCHTQIDLQTLCAHCQHPYSNHSMGIKGRCLACSSSIKGNCAGFIIPASCIPQPAAGLTTMCNHPNLGNALQCPDCKTTIDPDTACATCQCRWRDHTSFNKGQCYGRHGSGCPQNCPHFTLPPAPLPGGPVKPITGKVTWELEKDPAKPVDIKAQRKKDGVCVECGDRGTFINLQCMCSKGHGKIF